MTSLEHAKALAAALPRLGDYSKPNEYWIETIQKAMEAYAEPFKDAVAASELRIARLVGENAVCKDSLDSMELLRQEQATELAQLKEQNRELLKDKDELMEMFEWLLRDNYITGINNVRVIIGKLVAKHKALDKAALAKGEL